MREDDIAAAAVVVVPSTSREQQIQRVEVLLREGCFGRRCMMYVMDDDVC